MGNSDGRMVGKTSGRLVLYGNPSFATVWGQPVFGKDWFWKTLTFKIDSSRSVPSESLKVAIGSAHVFGQHLILLLYLQIKMNLLSIVFPVSSVIKNVSYGQGIEYLIWLLTAGPIRRFRLVCGSPPAIFDPAVGS